MSEPLPPPDPHLLELLRQESPAPTEARARARARLGLAVPISQSSGGEGSGGRPGGGAVSGGARAASALGAHGLAVVAFVLGGAAGAGLHAALTRPLAPPIVYVASPTAPVLEPPSTPTPASPRSAAPSAPRAPAVIDSATPVSPPAAKPHLSQMSGERSLLDAVRASLVQGNPGDALEALRLSRREFPHAILAEERDALTVEAMVGVGRYDDARAAADTFRKRFPDSLFSGAVDSAIRSIP